MKFIFGFLSIAAILGPVSAHSWVEEMQVIDSNGTYVGDYGYTRGYVGRTDAGFNGDSMDYLLPSLSSDRTRIDKTDLLCHPSQRSSSNGYTNSAYPRLQVSPGSYIAFKYLENGHVTLPQNQKGKPEGAGPVFVYGTTSPSDTEKIADVLEWTANGSGGDKRGVLLAAQDFDDGRCHQINSGSISTERQQQFPDRVPGQPTSSVEQWCESDVQIPSSQKIGDKLTLYWVWSWPTAPGQDPVYPQGKDEYYTSCAEIEIVDKVDEAEPVHTLVQQDPQTTAVSSFKSRTAYTTSPVYTLASGSATGSSMASSTYAATSTSSSLPSYSASTSYSSSSSTSSMSSAYSAPSPSTTSSIHYKHSHTSSASSSAGSSYMPNTVTVTDFVTLSAAATYQQKAQGTKTMTEWVTSYVTATPSTVLVQASDMPSVVAVPDSAGNAGLIGKKFRG